MAEVPRVGEIREEYLYIMKLRYRSTPPSLEIFRRGKFVLLAILSWYKNVLLYYKKAACVAVWYTLGAHGCCMP